MNRTGALLLTLITALLAATTARAGTYTVYSCKTPSGAWVGAEGWTADTWTPVQERDSGAVSGCVSPTSSLLIQFGGDRYPAEKLAGRRWTFTAPSDTKIQAFRVSRRFDLGWPVVSGLYDRPYVYDAWHDQDELVNRLEFHSPPRNGNSNSLGLDPVIESEGVRWGSISFRVRCWELTGDLLCGPLAARLQVLDATIHLEDLHPPTGSGALVGASPTRGVGRIAFTAADVGGGVYRAIVAVDGVEVGRNVVDGNGGTCGDVEPGNGDPREFAVPVPCRLEVAGEATFDTRGLRDGTHTVTLSMEDAAGNVTVIHEGQVSTHNAPVATEAPAVGGEARVGGALTASAGQWDGAPSGVDHRWLRCDADGGQCEPIAGAAGVTYMPGAADAYHRIVAEVVASNAGGSTVARSAPTSPVADGAGRTRPASDPASPGHGDDRNGGRGGTPETDRPASAGAPAPADRPVNPVAAQGGHAPNGTNASARARLTAAIRLAGGRTARQARAPRGRRWTVAGRLVDDPGRPIAEARVNALWRVVGRRWVARDLVRTDADGRFTYTLPSGPSREVRFTYYAFADSREVRTSATLRLDALSPLTITVDRRVVSGRGVVTIRGRASGERIPATGLLVTLQGHQRGFGWRTFRTLRTSSRGTWRARYRFRSSAGRFAFRAIVPRQGSYPFATTTSRPVSVSVR